MLIWLVQVKLPFSIDATNADATADMEAGRLHVRLPFRPYKVVLADKTTGSNEIAAC
jgi:hypothetical protein